MEKIEMKRVNRTAGILATALCLAFPVAAQRAGKAANEAPLLALGLACWLALAAWCIACLRTMQVTQSTAETKQR